jgi:hypothetical protein
VALTWEESIRSCYDENKKVPKGCRRAGKLEAFVV